MEKEGRTYIAFRRTSCSGPLLPSPIPQASPSPHSSPRASIQAWPLLLPDATYVHSTSHQSPIYSFAETETYLYLVHVQQILVLQHLARIDQPLAFRLDLGLVEDLRLQVGDGRCGGIQSEG